LLLVWTVGLLVASGSTQMARAGATSAKDAYAVVRPNQNPLAKGKEGAPVPTIEWEKVVVRPDHPRILFNRETVKALRARFPDHQFAESIEKRAENGDPLANAFMYQMTGGKDFAEQAIKSLNAGETKEWATPLVFDWTFDAMNDAQRKKAIERTWGEVSRDRASGWPRSSPYTSYPDDPRPSETSPDEWPPFYNWTFHDQDWCRRYSTSFYCVVALAGHHPRAAESVRNYWEYSLKDAVLFLDYLRDGSYWQGYYWSIYDRIGRYVAIFQTMKTACGIDYTDPDKHPWLANFGRWALYITDLTNRRTAHNYGDGEEVNMGRYSRARTSVLGTNSLARDPYVAWMLSECMGPHEEWLLEFLFETPNLVPKSPEHLPVGRAFPGTGQAILRSGWKGSDLWASVRWCDWFDMHCHGDAGSFLLYCKSPIAPDSGHYNLGGMHNINYNRRTIAHNTLTIRDPKSTERLNDGSQRVWDRRTWSYAIGTEAWVYHQDYHERGNLLAFETGQHYSYCAGEAARAYKKDTVKEFTRQAVVLNDGFFIVFDRVETAKPDLEKRWLVHTAGKPAMQGKVTKTEVKGHIEEFDGRVHTSKGRLGAIMTCHTLLPRDIRVRRVGGAILKIPVSALVKVPRTTQRIGTGSRWLWTDPLIIHYNDKITGKKLPAIVIERDRPSEAILEITDTEFNLTLKSLERAKAEEVKIKLADVPNILELVADLGRRDLWHTRVRYLPGYEYYNEGANYANAYGFETWKDYRKLAPELNGLPNDHGGWRVEVYPAKPAARDYFFHVFRVMHSEGLEPGTVGAVKETAERAETTITLGKRTYVLAFNKTGKIGGHVKITEGGKTLADADFVDKIVQKEWKDIK
jgi:hypothetical protein